MGQHYCHINKKSQQTNSLSRTVTKLMSRYKDHSIYLTDIKPGCLVGNSYQAAKCRSRDPTKKLAFHFYKI